MRKGEKEECMCKSGRVLVYSCSGGSNVGQISNEAAKSLAMMGIAKMACLAGIGGHVSGIIESGRSADSIVAIDGCSVHCAEKGLEHVGLKSSVHVVVTDLGMKKSYDLSFEDRDVELVTQAVRSLMQSA